MISILIPVYNCEQFIEETIIRLYSQDLKETEIIVRDDSSTDTTWSILLQLNKQYPFKLYKNHVNLGMCNNWNRLYEDAKGDYILKLDADDIFFPEMIPLTLKFFNENTTIDALAFKYKILESETNISKELPIHRTIHEEIQPNLLSLVFLHNPFHLCFTIFRKGALEKVKRADGLFMNTEVGDLDLLLRLAEKNIQLYYKPILAGYYRMHQTNSSKTPLKQAKSWLYDVFPKHERYLSEHLYFETKSVLEERFRNYIKYSIYHFQPIDFSYLAKSISTYLKFKKA